MITGQELEERLAKLSLPDGSAVPWAAPLIEEEADPPEPEPPPTDDFIAEQANRSLMVRWSHDTRAMLVMEFIRDHHLFAQLNAYLKKRLR